MSNNNNNKPPPFKGVFDAFETPKLPQTVTEKNKERMENEIKTMDSEMDMSKIESNNNNNTVQPAHRAGAPSEPPTQFEPIEVKMIDSNLFIAEESKLWRPVDARGVFGGQIVAQSLSCAQQTIHDERLTVHSLHSYFLMKGNDKRPIIYHVRILRDGKSFAQRLVTAQQDGSIIFTLMASFQIPHVGPAITHQFPMPRVPPPEELPTMEEYFATLLNDVRCPENWKPYILKRTKGKSPIDQRPAIVSDMFAKFGPPSPNRPRYPEIALSPLQAMWIRCKTRLGDAHELHTAVLAYVSDMGLISTAKHDTSSLDVGVIASLDHTMWFHEKFRADEWLLYFLQSPRAVDGRGLSHGYVYSRDGRLVVTTAQEGVLRLKL
jgi:acyl-CoA thioesterase II